MPIQDDEDMTVKLHAMANGIVSTIRSAVNNNDLMLTVLMVALMNAAREVNFPDDQTMKMFKQMLELNAA